MEDQNLRGLIQTHRLKGKFEVLALWASPFVSNLQLLGFFELLEAVNQVILHVVFLLLVPLVFIIVLVGVELPQLFLQVFSKPDLELYFF